MVDDGEMSREDAGAKGKGAGSQHEEVDLNSPSLLIPSKSVYAQYIHIGDPKREEVRLGNAYKNQK